MKLSLQTFDKLVQNMAAAVQSASSQLLDLTVGSVTRSLLEANASVGLWVQWLILQVLQTTRAATSTGADLDSWMADMTLVRLPAVAATGFVSFSRFTPSVVALIPAGALVRTSDGSQSFQVAVDTSNPSWNDSLNGYSLPAGVSSLTVPIVAQVGGAAGNVQAGAITMMVTAIPGVDSVVNLSGLLNGVDPESDAAFRARFQNFVQSRSRATPVAILYALNSVQQGLNCTIRENVDTNGNPWMGNFVVTVDDGTGSPSANLLSTLRDAIEGVRPIGSTFTVQAPTVVTANVALTITPSAGVAKSDLVGPISSAVSDYINSLPIGATLPVTRVAQLAYSTSVDISNVSQVLINGAPNDITPTVTGVVKAGTIAVN